MSEELSSQNEETKEVELASEELEEAAGGTGGWNRVKNVSDPDPGKP